MSAHEESVIRMSALIDGENRYSAGSARAEEDPQIGSELVVDLLSDLQHLCQAWGLDFAHLLHTARGHFDSEWLNHLSREETAAEGETARPERRRIRQGTLV